LISSKNNVRQLTEWTWD